MPVFFLAAAAFAFACGLTAARVYRCLPAQWLCDYNEAPAAHHQPQNRAMPPWGLLLMGLVAAGATLGAVRGLLCMQMWRTAAATVLYALLCATLLLSAWCDAVYSILPDQLLAAAALLGALLWLTRAPVWHTHWYSPLLGAAAGFLGLWAVQFLAAKLYKTEAMGFGDVKLLAVIGFICGPSGLGAAVLIAMLSAALVFAVLLAAKRVQRRSLFPFGPFLVCGALCATALWPECSAAAAWYLGLL